MSEQAISDVLARHLPGATVLFVTDSGGNRSVVAFEGPAAERIAGYRRAGFRVETSAELREAS